LKILELHQNKLKNPQILKQYFEHYFPPCETFKMTREKIENFEISKYENKKPSKFTRRKTQTQFSHL
jgi:hypothetical protein